MILLVILDDLGDAINKCVEDYFESILPKLEERLNSTADEIIDYIKVSAPRSGHKNSFAESFVKVTTGEGSNKSVSIYSEGKGGLTHLIEFGLHIEVVNM